MAAPAATILTDHPILYWPMNDLLRGNDIATIQEVMQGDPAAWDMVPRSISSNSGEYLNDISPSWGTFFGPCLSAEFWGSYPHNPAIASGSHHNGLAMSAPTHIPYGSGIDPLINLRTWTNEAWIRTPATSRLDYDFNTTGGYGGDTNANTAFLAVHGEGHPNDNSPPLGFGLNVGTNGFQLLGHRGSYMAGPNGEVLLSDAKEHHFVVTCEDDPVHSKQTFRVYIDGVLQLTDNTWATGSHYPVMPSIGCGGGNYTTFYGSIRHMSVYDYVLSESRTLAHYAEITCSPALPTLLAGTPVYIKANFDKEIFQSIESAGTVAIEVVSGADITRYCGIFGWEASGVAITDDTTIMKWRTDGEWHVAHPDPAVYEMGPADAYSVETTVASETGTWSSTWYAGVNQDLGRSGVVVEVLSGVAYLRLYRRDAIVQNVTLAAPPAVGDRVLLVTDWEAQTATVSYNDVSKGSIDLSLYPWYTPDGASL